MQNNDQLSDGFTGMAPEAWWALLPFVVPSVPVFIGGVVFVRRATGGRGDDELGEPERRVEELEPERN